MIDKLHPDLDYLRADPASGEKARADRGAVAPPVVAAPQPVAVTVNPLVWREQSNTCQVADTPWGSAAVQDESHALCPHRWGWWMVGSDEDDSATGYGHNIEIAKAAAQADYEARILSALTIQPADPLSDPRVKALVEAIQHFIEPARRTPDPAQIRADALREAAAKLAEMYDGGLLSWPQYQRASASILALIDTPLSPTAVDGSPAPDAGGKEGV